MSWRFRNRDFARVFTPVLPLSLEETQRPGIMLSIRLLPNNGGWEFTWPSTGDPYYRIVLQGQQIAIVMDTTNSTQTYVYADAGFTDYPPPLEVMPASAGQASSEINKPFLLIQWYGNAAVSYYVLQEFVSGNWVDRVRILEVGAAVYSYQTPVLDDETIHQYQVLAYNEIDQTGTGTAVDITPVVTPFNFVETDFSVSYDGTGHNIVFDLG